MEDGRLPRNEEENKWAWPHDRWSDEAEQHLAPVTRPGRERGPRERPLRDPRQLNREMKYFKINAYVSK